MLRFLLISFLAGLVPFGAWASPRDSRPVPSQTVKFDSKADSLLLSEIPHLVRAWSDRCESKEKAKAPDTPLCWREAAAAMDRYTSGISSSLIEQVQELQSAWLTRVAQLQRQADLLASEPAHISAVPPSHAQTAVRQGELRQIVLPRRKPQRAQLVTPKTRAERTRPAPSSKKTERHAAKKRPQPSPPAPPEIKKIRAIPAKAKPSADAQPARRSEIEAIRAKLKEIEGKLKCRSLRCENPGQQ